MFQPNPSDLVLQIPCEKVFRYPFNPQPKTTFRRDWSIVENPHPKTYSFQNLSNIPKVSNQINSFQKKNIQPKSSHHAVISAHFPTFDLPTISGIVVDQHRLRIIRIRQGIKASMKRTDGSTEWCGCFLERNEKKHMNLSGCYMGFVVVVVVVVVVVASFWREPLHGNTKRWLWFDHLDTESRSFGCHFG